MMTAILSADSRLRRVWQVSLRTELKFASLYIGGYPVRIERIVLVDVTMVVRVVLKALKRALPAKMRSKFHLSQTADGELYEQHVARDWLPNFLGGGASSGSGALLGEKTIAYWSKLHETRAATCLGGRAGRGLWRRLQGSFRGRK